MATGDTNDSIARALRIDRCLAIGCGFAFLAMVATCGILGLIPDKVTDANFEVIREGMTLAEVEAILGTPDRQLEISQEGPPDHVDVVWRQHGSLWDWAPHTLEITLEFKEGKVVRKRKFDYWL